MGDTSELKRAIDLRGAIAINVITMIGIGPLVTIPLVIAALGGPLALVGWIAGAVVALCDGLVWAELSSLFPGSGGTYVYLRNTFGAQGLGRALAFLFNWQFLLYAPCLLASGYIGFANYAAYFYPPLATHAAAHDAVAAGIGIVTILLLYRKTSQVASLGTVLAIAATLTVALVALAGLSHADFGQAFHLAQPVRFGAGFLAGFGTALYITLYDYVGYAAAALLGDEVVRPRRTIPVAIVLSVLIVAALYVLLQIGVLGVVPWQSLLDAHGQPTAQAQYVGAFVVERTWGRFAAVAVTLLVLVTAFASLYGNLLGFSRISFAAARDGAFLPAFARLHPGKQIPHVALLSVGALSLVASLFTLDQVIAFLTAGIVLIQGIAQVVALAILRLQRIRAPFRMPLYPLPAILAFAGWTLAFVSSGLTAIALGVGWLAVGCVVFLIAAKAQRWWPFLLAALFAFAFPLARADAQPAPWSGWNVSRITSEHGYPVFSVNGRPFFIYGAAFFYERIPRDRWRSALLAYQRLGINTIDLYLIWNWHEPSEGVRDFSGATDPRRDLLGLLKLTHELGFNLILRPGPVIRNEWQNGGYPPWLLRRGAYDMPLHDVLEGRYPATATLQNHDADAAGAEWLANETHRRYAARWLADVLQTAAPYAKDVIAIALDDDQGAYLDNNTWPAPRWRAYIEWLRSTVRSVVGPRVPLFLNTYEMKVPAASPVWAWGNWYQSNAYRIGAHDLADLDFATGLLQTQTRVPLMQAEFQAGWLQGADEAAPRPSDPSNTVLALNQLLRNGAHGIVNFPVQDTIYPDGWEAPWANWSYAWDAAFTVELGSSARYGPTAAFGDSIRRYGGLLARTHPEADAGIIWPPTLFLPRALTNDDFQAFADATAAMQHQCATLGLTCKLIDLAYADRATLKELRALAMPILPSARLTAVMQPRLAAQVSQLRRSGRLVRDLSLLAGRARARTIDATILLGDDRSFAFIAATNPSDEVRSIGPITVKLAHRDVLVPAFALPARSARFIPVGVRSVAPGRFTMGYAPASPPPFSDDGALSFRASGLSVAFAPSAGARIAELAAPGFTNAATSIGLLRDAVDPEPTPSARDYIAANTHPLPAGTFNRTYGCVDTQILTQLQERCAYDAPDLPQGGARFERILTLDKNGNKVVVDLRYTPHDPESPTRLESISGFAFSPGDLLLTPGTAIGILHGTRLVMLRWSPGDVARVGLRQTRGAELVTLVFARKSVELWLSVLTARDATEAQRLLDAKQP
jgi:amino acid transporter